MSWSVLTTSSARSSSRSFSTETSSSSSSSFDGFHLEIVIESLIFLADRSVRQLVAFLSFLADWDFFLFLALSRSLALSLSRDSWIGVDGVFGVLLEIALDVGVRMILSKSEFGRNDFRLRFRYFFLSSQKVV